MEMPVPTAADKALSMLEGSWIGQEKLHPSPIVPEGAITKGRVDNRRALDGFAVIQDYEQETDGKINFRGHGVFRWDAEKQAYMLHWFELIRTGSVGIQGHFDGSCAAPDGDRAAGFRPGDLRLLAQRALPLYAGSLSGWEEVVPFDGGAV